MTDRRDELRAALEDRYEIEHELGAGGMATVYLAHDSKHDRKVAVKVLRPELAAVLGAERFVQEIKTTANLQHPHILPLFDSGEADGFLYYVMPFIDGETLRNKLDRETQLGIDEAVQITCDVADALDYAHRHSVIHRDIKPENILLHDGRPMVADFGIALAVSAAAGGRMTETGLSLGTPHYMSPEQATAEKDLTNRSDIYSLGSVLYEMLTGSPPHVGSTAQQIVMKIVTDEVRPVAELRKTVPPNVAAATAKALEKLPADRFAAASLFAEALTNPAAAPLMTTTAGAPARMAPRAVGLLITAFAVGAMMAWLVKPSAKAPGRYDIGLPPDAPMVMHDWSLAMTVAPQGDFLVYRAGSDSAPYLRYQSLGDTVSFAIPGTEGGTAPAVSPDGAMLVFLTRQTLNIVPVAGGPVRSIAEVHNPTSVRWVGEDRVLLSDRDAGVLRWVEVESGREEIEEVRCLLPQPLPGNRVLCAGGGSLFARVLEPDRTIEHFVRIGQGGEVDSASYLRGADFRLVDDAYLLYMSMDGDLRAVPFDPESLETGRPVTLIPGIRRQSYTGIGQFGVGADGTLAFALGVNGDVGRLVSWTEGGQPTPLVSESAMFLRYDLSSDARQLAAVVQRPNGQELRRYDLSSGQWDVWHRGERINEPRWLSSDRLLASSADVEGKHWVLIAGSPTAMARPDTLLEGEGHMGLSPFSSSRAGDIIATIWREDRIVLVRPSAETATVEPLVNDAVFGVLSQDDRWLAFQPRGPAVVLVSPYPSLDRREQIARDVSEPQWLSPTELVFWKQGGTFYRARIDPATGRLVGSPTVWHQDSRFSDTPGHSFTLTADGDLVYVQEPEQRPAAYLRVIPDWVEHMKEVVDQANR